MKKIVITIIVVALILVVCSVVGFLFLKKSAAYNTLDGPGMINPNATAMACKEIEGEYEKGLGSRTFIKGTDFNIKSRNDYILTTKIVDAYSTGEYPERTYIVLEDGKMILDGNEIGTIRESYVDNKVLHLIVEYTFGERDEEYEWTDEPEFYYYKIVTDKYMKKLEGEWVNGDLTLKIENNQAQFYYDGSPLDEVIDVCVVCEHLSSDKPIYLTCTDLYDPGVGMFTKMLYKDGKLCGSRIVMDEDSKTEVFTKVSN